ncbi:membrane protein insertase YidC [Candidatus Fermentibacteria bacterium]|nr:membrane protein insertase YidC [Candidatus Fermentibacteria bacterium]
MSDQKRLFLAAVLMAAVLFVSWALTGKSNRQEQPPASPSPQPSDDTPVEIESPDTTLRTAPTLPESIDITARTITVLISDGSGGRLVEGVVSTGNGNITSWQLINYNDLSVDEGLPVDLAGGSMFAVEAPPGGAFSTNAPDTLKVEETTTLTLEGADGSTLEYTFHPGSYAFGLRSQGLGPSTALAPKILPVTERDVKPGKYFQAVWYTDKKRDEDAEDVDEEKPVGRCLWAGVRSKYFVVIMLPETSERAEAFLEPAGEESPGVSISDGNLTVYAGPVSYRDLSRLGSRTDEMVDFGWPIIRWIGKIVFWFGTSALSFVGNWGLRIIIISLALKLILMPLTSKSFKSMQKLKEVQPKLREIQKKHKDDSQRQHKELQKLYHEEGVNPLGGCFPLLLQMPFFFALYRVLSNMVELRGAEFVLWIRDLSRPEILIPFGTSVLGLSGIGLLPVLMGVSMFVQQKMTVTDPKQKGMVYFMPVLFTWLFMRFPAGLTLYWFMNNLLTIGQQELIKKRLGDGKG